MSVIHEPRLFRIRALQRAYAALQKDLPYLEERIHLLRVVVSDCAISSPHPSYIDGTSLARYRCDLGSALYDRFLHVRELGNLKEAEMHLRLALSGRSPTVAFPGTRHLLGCVLREHGGRTSNISLVDEALLLHRYPFRDHNPSHISTFEQAHHSRELGRTLLTRHVIAAKDETVIRDSVRHLKDAHAMFAAVQATDHISCHALREALKLLCYLQLDRAHMEDALSYGVSALSLCGPAHRDVYSATEVLSSTQSHYYWCFGHLESLNHAISLQQTALASAPPNWAYTLTIGLISALNRRFMKLNREEDLLEAIARATRLLETSGSTHEYSDCALLQHRLSRLLHTRFMATGAPEDIEAAANAANPDSSASAVDPGTTLYASCLSQFAICRGEQYMAYGDVSHLEECIGLFERVLQLVVTHSHGYWMTAGGNLLVALHLRYKATGRLPDLDRAFELIPALNDVQKGRDTQTAHVLVSAGDAFLSRFRMTGVLEDLQQATKLHQEAATHKSAFYDHQILSTCATTLRTRYEVLHEQENVTKALELQNKASAALSEVHPDRPEVICGLARIRLCATPAHAHVSEALGHLLDALHSDYSPAYKRLKHVSDVLTYLAAHMSEGLSHENALKLSVVYSTVIDLLPQVASFGLDPRARLAVISGAGQLTIQGAAHAISIGRFDQALEMLEAGRNVFWTQGLRLRTPFTNLPKTIGDRLTKISYALSRPPPEGADKDHELARRRKLGDEFQTVLAEARLEPGFHDLLRNASFDSLTRAAQYHPIIVFVSDEACGHALIILADGDCRHVPLPQATTKALQAILIHIQAHIDTIRSQRGIRRVAAKDTRPTDVYRKLWTLVMRRVLEALQWDRAEGRQRRRLTLCPTGVFMRLPLHAAGVYTGNDQVCCSDYFVSSYTPSIGALLHAQRSFRPVRRSSETETLVVAVEQPCQGAALPEAIKEAAIVREHVSPSKTFQVSTTDGVLKHTQTASILHLACHGTQNLSDALQSGFHLEDAMLTISKLTELELPRAFLAVLSACETAKGDTAQPDQAIHLAGAMLFAGFKSVVATMWSMRDQEGPVVAKSIYSALFKAGDSSEHLNPDDVPYALDDAVRRLRESGLDPSFWATYVHIGI